MDFRLPQPLKYSLKKKKGRRKMQRKETSKLSLKNHNKNVSCQTDSSESSEPSGSSATKIITRHSKGRKSIEKMAAHNYDFPSLPVESERNPSIDPSSLYNYSSSFRIRGMVDHPLHIPEVKASKNNEGPLMAPEDLSGRIFVDSVEIIGRNRNDIDRPDSILTSESDSDSTSDCGNSPRDEECRGGRISESPSIQSDGSKALLESSLNSQGSLIVPSDSAKGKVANLLCFDDKSGQKNVPLVRSSVLHKKFNRAVENDLAIACSSSDFYTRVKNRVLGLHHSNSIMVNQDKILDSPEKTYRDIRNYSPETDDFFEDEKENVDVNKLIIGRSSHLGETLVQKTMIAPDSEDSSFDSQPRNLVNNTIELNCSKLSEVSLRDKRSKSVVISESSISTLQDSDIRNVDTASKEENNSNGGDVVRLPKIKKTWVISDSDDSSVSDSRKRKELNVIDSSGCDSSVIEINSDSSDKEDNRCVKDNGKQTHSEERSRSRKALWSSENGDRKSEPSDLFPRMEKGPMILESVKSSDINDKACDIQMTSEINLQFKPGFSTLSQSKHEDIKKWLNAIPCHPDMDGPNSCTVELHSDAVVNSKGGEGDNVSLTEMEKVLDELYGKDWGDKKKPLVIKGPRKKESQIICQRLTDSDDSPTPPLPASTPKKKLYNHNVNMVTPQEISCETPRRGKNIFTPLSTDGKRGGNNTHKTPKTADPKHARSQDCLNSGSISSPILKFLSSLSVDHQSARCHPEAKYFVKNFKSKKNELSQKLFNMFNKNVFDSKLPNDLPIIWNNRLRKTAGYCYNRRVKNSEGGFTRTSRVELSSKIVDNAARLRDTLIHELCHAATWIISEVTGGHGPSWKRWTNKAMLVFPELPPISRCHNYDIVTKYKYQCTVCNYSIGRHSKSLDIQRKCCGICGGTFELFLNAKDEAGKAVPRTPRTPNAFALFVKENYKVIKSTQDKIQHKDVMKLLSEKFAQSKITTVPNEK